MSKKETKGCSIKTYAFIVFSIFLVLKLTNTIDWSWIWVTSPLWITMLFSLVFLLVGFFLMILTVILTVLKNKNE